MARADCRTRGRSPGGWWRRRWWCWRGEGKENQQAPGFSLAAFALGCGQDGTASLDSSSGELIQRSLALWNGLHYYFDYTSLCGTVRQWCSGRGLLWILSLAVVKLHPEASMVLLAGLHFPAGPLTGSTIRQSFLGHSFFGEGFETGSKLIS